MRKWIFKNDANPIQANIVVVGFASVFFLWGMGASTAVAAVPDAPLVPPHIKCVAPAMTEAKIEVSDGLADAIRFQMLAKKWSSERGPTSSIEEMCTSPAYLDIMAMGPPVLPFIFQQLRFEGENPDHWFVALHHLTKGAEPVADEDKGDMRRMADAWLKWSDQQIDAG